MDKQIKYQICQNKLRESGHTTNYKQGARYPKVSIHPQNQNGKQSHNEKSGCVA